MIRYDKQFAPELPASSSTQTTKTKHFLNGNEMRGIKVDGKSCYVKQKSRYRHLFPIIQQSFTAIGRRSLEISGLQCLMRTMFHGSLPRELRDIAPQSAKKTSAGKHKGRSGTLKLAGLP